MAGVIGAEVKIRRLKGILTGGKEGTIENFEAASGRYCVDFHNGFVGWYKLEELWIKSLKTGKWVLYE